MSEEEQKSSRCYPVISPEASNSLIGQLLIPTAVPLIQLFGNNLAGAFVLAFLIIVAQIFVVVGAPRRSKAFEWLEIVDEELVFHGRKGIKRFPLANLSVLPLGASLRIVTPDGKKHSVPQPLAWHGTRPVAEEFYNHLLGLGVSIDGKSPPGAPYDPREFKLISKLTTAVNWRWEGYAKLVPFLEHKIKFEVKYFL